MALCRGKSLQHNMRAVKYWFMNGNLSNKDVLYVHVMISDMKRTSHHAVIITNYAIWHQSLKSIPYRILLIFQTKKTTDLRVKTWGG